MTSILEADGGYVVLTGTGQWDEVAYWSRCPELGVASCGDTIEEVLDGLAEAIEVYLEDWDDPDDLARMLRENGVAIATGPLPRDSVKASVPVGKIVRVYTLPVPAPVAV